MNKHQNQRGNILFYILIGCALFAALSFVLSKSDGNGEGTQLGNDKAGILAGGLSNYPTQVKNVLNQMLVLGGNTIDTLDFTLPSAGTFNTAPLSRKVFHTAGGGLNVFSSAEPLLYDPASTRKQGWVILTGRSVGWAETRNSSGTLITPTSDILFNFVDVNPTICAALNYRITGSETIPDLTVAADSLFLSTASADLTTTNCPGCNSRPSLCVKGTDNIYVYYNIVAQR